MIKGLFAFGHDLQTQVAGHRHDRHDQRALLCVFRDVPSSSSAAAGSFSSNSSETFIPSSSLAGFENKRRAASLLVTME